METMNTMRPSAPQMPLGNRVVFNFPKEKDILSYWQTIEQLGWLPYIERESEPREDFPVGTRNFLSLNGILPDRGELTKERIYAAVTEKEMEKRLRNEIYEEERL